MEGFLDAPIPGQSLTQAPGAAPWEHPVRFTDPAEATDYLWNLFNTKKKLTQLLLMLKKGVPVEYIANTVIFQGFTEGLWNVDVAQMIKLTVVRQIAAIGKTAGISDLVIANPDLEQQKFVAGYLDLLDKKKSPAKTKEPEIFKGILGAK